VSDFGTQKKRPPPAPLYPVTSRFLRGSSIARCVCAAHRARGAASMTSERASESGGQECRSWNRERSWHCVGFVNRGSGGQLGARVFQAAQDSGLDEVHDLCADGPRCAAWLP